MNAFFIAVIMLSLWTILDSGELLPEDEFLDEIVDEMAEESIIAPEINDLLEIACSNVTLGADFDDFVGTILRNLTTNDISECCEVCQELERCTTWSRNREDGYCELYEMERLSFFTDPEFELDIGGIIEIQGQLENSEVNGTRGSASVRGNGRLETRTGVIAPREVVLPECGRTLGFVYPRGKVIVAGQTPSAEFCCRACRKQEGCTSWVRIRSIGDCLLYEIESAVIERHPWLPIDVGGFSVETHGPPDITELGVSPSTENNRSFTFGPYNSLQSFLFSPTCNGSMV